MDMGQPSLLHHANATHPSPVEQNPKKLNNAAELVTFSSRDFHVPDISCKLVANQTKNHL